MEQTIAQRLGIKKFPFEIKDENGKILYHENIGGYWEQKIFNENCSTYKNSGGCWEECTYDEKGNLLTSIGSNGIFFEYAYDEKESLLTSKDSNGFFMDYRPKQVELTLDEIANKFGIDVNQLKIKK